MTYQTPETKEVKVERLDFLDFLKGFAIFLMVMGHFLSWTFDGNIDNRPTNSMFIRNLIYSFHMPLFFFVAGYLVDLKKNTWNFSNVISLTKKRFFSLIVPGLTFMILAFFKQGLWHFEWFLMALFQSYIFFTLTKYICFKIKKNNIFLEIIGHILVYCLLHFITIKFSSNHFFSNLSFSAAASKYPFFLMGYLFLKFNVISLIQRKSWIYTLSIILFSFLFFLFYYKNIGHAYATSHLLAFFGIIICLKNAIRIDFTSPKKWVQFFLTYGKCSLAIYLISPYFIPSFPELGQYFIQADTYTMWKNQSTTHITSIFLQIISGSLIAFYVCSICNWIQKILQQSSLLALLMFGKRSHN